MCGIVGIVSHEPVANRLLRGLQQLEYRGYDSAGIATIDNNTTKRLRAEGKLTNLEKLLTQNALPGNVGIGHTRWATHGLPNTVNAHPHATERVAIVHNGIIENYRELKDMLEKEGVKFTSQTDTEVILHLIDREIRNKKTPKEAVFLALKQLEGAFALGIIFAAFPNMLIGARKGSPLAVGYGTNEMFMGSDAIALAPFTNKISYLEEGDVVILTPSSAQFYNASLEEVTRPVKITALTGAVVGKGEFRHFMLKEIYEQPTVIGETMGTFCNFSTGEVQLPPLPFDLTTIERVVLIACGTSHYSTLVARYWLETVAHIATEIDIASEYRYRDIPASKNTLAIFVSQSGETADTLAALRTAKAAGNHCIAVVNVAESTMAQEAHAVILTHAGPEISVASTKGFTTQLTTLACFTLALAMARKSITQEKCTRLMHALAEVPARIVELLHHEEEISRIAHTLARAQDILFMGRGTSYPIALEGALKLKELSYIHAEGYAAGEFKHGPLALIDERVPVIVIAPTDALLEKTLSNTQEVIARGGKIIFIGDAKGLKTLGADHVMATIIMPTIDPFVTPLLYAVPVQLLAYHTAIMKGTDVDQPRNLAKSVTVE